MPELDEYTMERVLEEFEQRCYDNMNHAIETEEGLGIEYDEDVVCDVCQSPDGEDGNEMVFCDKCNICVHQVSLERAQKEVSWSSGLSLSASLCFLESRMLPNGGPSSQMCSRNVLLPSPIPGDRSLPLQPEGTRIQVGTLKNKSLKRELNSSLVS